jgi:mannose-6-phosphate isomerase-like protein (cupin superfamily)
LPHNLNHDLIHLGLGATAIVQPPFTGGMGWYEGYGARHGNDGAEGRLVAMHSFSESWDSWEMHPLGDEVVLCISGTIILTQEAPDGRITKVALGPGDYAINAPGVWHTADVEGAASVLFITAGMGTVHRPR